MSNTILVAVASKHGLGIDEHFGHAKKFMIYQLTNNQCNLLGTREVEHYCLGGTSNKPAMGGIIEAIRDCHAVFVVKIGYGPTEILKIVDVRAIYEYAYEEIEASLLHYYRELKNG